MLPEEFAHVHEIIFSNDDSNKFDYYDSIYVLNICMIFWPLPHLL